MEENRPQNSADVRDAVMTGNGQAWLMAGKEKQDRRGHPGLALARMSKRWHEICMSNLIETMFFFLGGGYHIASPPPPKNYVLHCFVKVVCSSLENLHASLQSGGGDTIYIYIIYIIYYC